MIRGLGRPGFSCRCHFSSLHKLRRIVSLSFTLDRSSRLGGDHNLSSGHQTVASPRGKHAVAAAALHSRLSRSVHVDTASKATAAGGNAKHTHEHVRTPPLMLRRFRRYHMCTTIIIDAVTITDNVGLVRPTLNLRLNPKRPLALPLSLFVPLEADGGRRAARPLR